MCSLKGCRYVDTALRTVVAPLKDGTINRGN